MSEALVNREAEWSVVAAMLTAKSGELIGELVGAQIEALDFVGAAEKLLYATVVERYYSDQPIDPISVAEPIRAALAKAWDISPERVPEHLLTAMQGRDFTEAPLEHAAIVKRLSTGRKLLNVTERASASLQEGAQHPEEIVARMGAEALQITSGHEQRGQLKGWMEIGTGLAKHLQRLKLARERGIELSIKVGYPFVDDFTLGIAPSELWFLAGAPGVGKSGFAWAMAQGFAEKQMFKKPEHRVGTLVVSMEMGEISSTTRLASAITGIDGGRLREGDITQGEYGNFLREWKSRDGLPVFFNYASNFRISQLRALVIEGIRRHNVGFVIIDHFRQVDADRYYKDPNENDEVKVRFLKEQIAKDLDVGVLCLAHTIKIGRASEGSVRPKLADLRGSGQIAANADFVSFLHKPGAGLEEEEKMTLDIRDTDMEILWEKSRHARDGMSVYSFDPAHMTVSERN